MLVRLERNFGRRGPNKHQAPSTTTPLPYPKTVHGTLARTVRRLFVPAVVRGMAADHGESPTLTLADALELEAGGTPSIHTWHHTTPRHTTAHRTTPHHTTPHHTAPHRTTPHHTTPQGGWGDTVIRTPQRPATAKGRHQSREVQATVCLRVCVGVGRAHPWHDTGHPTQHPTEDKSESSMVRGRRQRRVRTLRGTSAHGRHGQWLTLCPPPQSSSHTHTQRQPKTASRASGGIRAAP